EFPPRTGRRSHRGACWRGGSPGCGARYPRSRGQGVGGGGLGGGGPARSGGGEGPRRGKLSLGGGCFGAIGGGRGRPGGPRGAGGGGWRREIPAAPPRTCRWPP